MFLLLCISLAIAGDDVVTLEKGVPAPFTGTLLSPQAAARLLADSDSDLQKCLATASREKKLLTADKDLIIKTQEAELASCTIRLSETELLYQQRVEFLEKRSMRPDWETPVFFTTGVITGITIMFGSAWILDKIGD